MIRFVFWFIISVIMAYFMTDIKIGGKTIKELIDGYLDTQSGKELKLKAGQLIDNGIGSVLSRLNDAEKKQEPKVANEKLQVATDEQAPQTGNQDDADDLRKEDTLELEKVIKDHN